MSPRLAPALGLAAACAMLTGVGIIAISAGDDGGQPTEVVAAIIPTPSHAAAKPKAAVVRPKTTHVVTAPATSDQNTTAATPVQSSVDPNPPAGTIVASSSSPSISATTPSTNPPSSPSTPAGSGSVPNTAPPLRTTSGANRDTYAQAVFNAVNQARAAYQLPPLVWSPDLQVSAHRHNVAMAQSNTLSHQVDGEPALGARETAAGVQWTSAAENIGWTTDRSQAGAVDIENRMCAETAPNDAHKRNILSRSVTSLGVDVYIDAAHGRLWLTEDFSG